MDAKKARLAIFFTVFVDLLVPPPAPTSALMETLGS